MKNLTTLGLTEAIREGRPLAALAYIDHPDGEVFAWSGAGTLEWDGKEWLGLANFGRLVGVGGSKRLTLRSVTFELSGIPGDLQLDETVRNRPAKAWIAGLTEAGRVNGEPWQIVDGLCDYQEIKISDDGDSRVILIVAEPVFSIERAQSLSWTPEWLKATRHAGAVGLDPMSTLANKQVSWTRT